MNLTVIIPTKKEGATIASCVKRVAASCAGAEILVMDSGLDNTKNIIETLQSSILNLKYILNKPDRGKGDAIANGIKLATGNIIVQIDADLQFMPEEISLLIEPILNNRADMTLGSRFMRRSIRREGSTPALRSFGNYFVSWLNSILFGQKITDALAGMKAWRKEVTQSFQLTSYTYTYEVELFARALRKKWRVLDVPITTEARAHGISTVPVFKTGMRLLRDSIKFRFF